MIRYNRNYYVPCVAKSRDYLIGFLDAFVNLRGVVDIDENILDSCRFTEWMPDGSKRSDKSPEEIKEIMEAYQESLNVKENENPDSEIDKPYFQVSCSCGNFHSFKHQLEIPSEKLVCEICGKILIDYTNNFDYMFDYVGDVSKMTAEFESDEEDENEE